MHYGDATLRFTKNLPFPQQVFRYQTGDHFGIAVPYIQRSHQQLLKMQYADWHSRSGQILKTTHDKKPLSLAAQDQTPAE